MFSTQDVLTIAMPALHIDGVALLPGFHATEQRRTEQRSSRGCLSCLLLQEQVYFHRITVWKSQNRLLFASGGHAILKHAPAEQASSCKHQHGEMRQMRESDTDASHQKQENESRNARRDEGSLDWRVKEQNCFFDNNIGSKFGTFQNSSCEPLAVFHFPIR